MLKGIDISQHQSTTPSLDGLSFIVLRSSIATTKDTKYDAHYAAARNAGLVVMAYHFGYSKDQSNIADQVTTFLAAAKNADFLWIDQEEAGFDDAQTQEFVDRVRDTGRPIGLYHSSAGFSGVNVDAKWVADWRDASVAAGYPRTADGTAEFPAWDLWQYRGSPLDLDYLNPDRPLANLLRKGYLTPAQKDAAVSVAVAAAVAPLNTQIAAQQTTISAQTTTISTQQATITDLQDDLDEAPGIERERIAVASGAAEANRIRAI